MKFEDFDWRSLPESIVIGVDEVGRGCLAGPVYSACAIIDTDKAHTHFKDSKSLTAKKREVLALDIEAHHRVALGQASVEEIAELNILHAALLSMKRAFLNLNIPESEWVNCHLLVDGKFKVSGLPGLKQTAVIKGDQRATPIAAASIFAKVKRDQLLIEYGQIYPEYGFQNHKAYATKEHKEAISKHGPCKVHRKLLPESVSTGRRLKGLKAEEFALQYFLKNQFQLLAQRERIVGVEVDLLFKKENELHIVEVKTYREGFPLISASQLKRLKRVANALDSRHRSSIRLHLAAIERDTELNIHWDIGDEV